jgi:hypothetical protein
MRAFDSVGQKRPNVPQTLVYDQPNIDALGTWLWQRLSGKGPAVGSETDVGSAVAAMKSMIRSQLDVLANSVGNRPRSCTNGNGTSQGRAVLVTGTTGGLGSYLLETLLADDSVSEVFALNRRPRSSRAESTHNRQKAAFAERGIAQSLLNSPKLIFVDADRVDDIAPNVISRVSCCSLLLTPFFSRLTACVCWSSDPLSSFAYHPQFLACQF